MSAIDIPPISKVQADKYFKRLQFEKAGRNSLCPVKIFSGSMGNIGSNFTFRQKFEVPYLGEDVLVRAVFENDTAASFSIPAVSASSGRAWADVKDCPIRADGSAGVWSVDQGGAITVPAGSASYATDGTSGLAYSGWMPVHVEQRTDDATVGLIYLSTYTGGAAVRGQIGNAAYPFSQYPSIAGLKFRSNTSYSSADRASANQNIFDPGANTNTNYAPAWIEIASARDVVSIANCGDSTDQGYSTDYSATTSGVWSWLPQAANQLSSVARPVTWQNYGHAGKTSTFIKAQRRALITDAERRPTILVMQPFSQNDDSYSSLATAQAAWADIVTDIQSCIAAGITPVVRTLLPTVTATTVARDFNRLWVNAQVRKLATPIFDIDAALSDGAFPARVKAGYVGSDGIHLNDAGNALAAQRLIQDIGFLIR